MRRSAPVEFLLVASVTSLAFDGVSSANSAGNLGPTVANAPLAQAGVPALTCDAAAIRVPEEATIETVKAISTPVPYCRFDGYYTTRRPGPNKVRFMLAAPHNWNGRFLFTVQGGSAGWVPDPSPAHLTEGYAVAATDKGVTTSSNYDFTFYRNPAMYEDYWRRGVHVSSIVTQVLAKQYYAKQKFPRYIMGCSGGGMGTAMEAEAYPGDYDGFIAGGIPNAGKYAVMANWAAIAYHVNHTKGSWISPDEYVRIYQALLAKYDASDGAVDGLIWDPRVIKLDSGDRETLSFLSNAQFDTLKLITGGLRSANGEQLAYGYLLGNPTAWPRFLTGTAPPPWANVAAYPAGFAVAETGAQAIKGPTFSYLSGADPSLPGYAFPDIVKNPLDSRRLVPLASTGAKVIMWIGTAEEAIPPTAMIAYTEDLSRRLRGGEDKFYRFFLIPGMHHCGRGDNAPTDHVDKLLKAAENWVERGVPPDQVTLSNGLVKGFLPTRNSSATWPYPQGQEVPDRTYLLCAYPNRSVFKGGVDNKLGLDVKNSNNWKCIR